MRARFKAPSGTGVIEFGDDATVQTIFNELRSKTNILSFTIKYGPPMAMKSLSLSQKDESAKGLKLNGETLTVVPDEARLTLPSCQPQAQEHQEPSMRDTGRDIQKSPDEANPEDITVAWPEREGTLLVRVMPSDNSCLFTAFGGALPNQLPASRLRTMMADYIVSHSSTYTEAVLGASPAQYCRSIMDPDRWGGGIELSILSSIFDIQICTFDVQNQNLMNFGEDKNDRCVLLYSGIHYDRVAFSYTEPPYTSVSLPPEMDRTVWPTSDDEILKKTLGLVEKLNAAHYFTDTEGLILKCDVPGCDWIGSGQLEGRKHAEKTGHVELSEIKDFSEDNVVKVCDAPGCDFMGQGDKVVRAHTSDTGHGKFSVIPDD